MTGTTTIAGRYRIEGRLGVGGMSTVHLAFDQRLERYVALKLLAEHLADDPAFVSRFRREALAAARLVHPNIVQVYDFGFDDGHHQHFIVMEHVRGRSCAEMLRERGHLDVEQAIDVVTQACRGLDYAHRHGVVHRDVKPGNLLVSDADVVKLADFGIARATDQSSITQVGSVLGTAAYLAPEQARGEEAGPSADLYSLGVLTYQLLSGRLPYEASSLSELALKQQRESPVPLDRLNPRVRSELAQTVAMALALEPEGRPANAIVLAQALSGAAAGRSPISATAATAHLASGAATQALPPPGPRSIRAPRDRASATERLAARTAPPRTVAPRPARAATASTARSQQIRSPRPPMQSPAPAFTSRSGRRGHALRRFGAVLALALVLIAAVATAVVIADDASTTTVRFRAVVARDFRSGYDQVQTLINQYTK